MGYKKQVFRSLAMVTQLGISVMTPIFLCIFAGCWVDNHFGTKTTLFFLLLGVLAGGRCGYHMAKITFLAGEKDDRKEKEEEQRLRRKEQKDEAVSRPKPVSRVRGAGVPNTGGLDLTECAEAEGKRISAEGKKNHTEENHDQ